MTTKPYNMRSFNNAILRISGTLFLLLSFTFNTFAQETANEAPAVTEAAGSGIVVDKNFVLTIVALVLLLILGALALTLKSSMELYKRRQQKEKQETGMPGKIISILIGLLFFSALPAFAQGSPDAAPQSGPFSNTNLLSYVLIFIIVGELVAIFAIIKWIRFFTGIEELQTSKGKKGFMGISFSKFWQKINQIKPVKDEAEIDMGHNYDGIRELDNVMPPWFTWSFVATIVFAVIYMWRFHGSATPAPDQYQEYEQSVTLAKTKLDAYLASKGENVDETNVKMLGKFEIEEGKKLYAASCIACHGASGEGGVGPNLTDDYWLHGGSIGDVFKTIKLGVVEKGMQSWKDVFSATQIAQISSYVKSIHGTNPAGSKPAQGDVYVEKAETAASPTADSTVAIADSAATK